MNDNPIYIGDEGAHFVAKEVAGKSIDLEGEKYYKISNYDAMRPFFMSILSDSNHWMFISSNGGLSAGRQNAQSSLFPYYTDDKITESSDITGSKTIVQVHSGDKTHIWHPFSEIYEGVYETHRNLYKNSLGDRVIFEEVNESLGLTFRYQWNSSDRFGFVKKSTLINTTDDKVQVTVLDGIQNILPYGVPSDLQNRQSNLVDAYKKSELVADVGMGIYALSAIIVDRAEPSEALKATTVWSTGIENANYLVSSLQLDAFGKGQEVRQETDVRAEKGAYFIYSDLVLASNAEKSWMVVSEVNQSVIDIHERIQALKTKDDLFAIVQDDIELGSRRLRELGAATDAAQLTADGLRNTRHFSNSLFNIMRGGIFDDNYQIERWDFLRYIKKANKKVYAEKEHQISELPEQFSLQHLRQLAHDDQYSDFKRLAFEYMPLKFSRRHGDPSRPWNIFSINTTASDGSKILDYEGNWRDIFQNWEALAHSYPEFIENMIHKFLNATTFDGYNPYRITKDGFDWEIIEPEDPWSYIGYWGDHQIIYLLKFLEFSEDHYPGRLASYFDQALFVYANVPYKIKNYKAILNDPKDTIEFDEELDGRIRKERLQLGADAALLKDQNANIYKVNLMEKLLATVLSKVSNFIPEGGIWMNTQRPEWNDANNALVGNGVSMVTLCYLRRFLTFFEGIIEEVEGTDYLISKELVQFFNEVRTSLTKSLSILNNGISDSDRKTVMDNLGNAGSEFRSTIYRKNFSGKTAKLASEDVLQFIQVTLQYLEHSIDANKRQDHLYHSYNLITIKNDTDVAISHLSEMLEGQVAVLSSGHVSGKAALQLLDAMKKSALFRHDQYSYLLYPNKELPRFLDKNNIPFEKIKDSKLIKQLLKDGNSQIVEKDINGNYHFNGSFNNANSLMDALGALPDRYSDMAKKDAPLLTQVFEDVFNHKAFTGRSGTFFGYEGLGSIYWHMVSKLLLAVQETCIRAVEKNESPEIVGRLMEHYYEINEGIGVHKSPELYGAFPTDPYSHTPAGKGAQQPGMTGQVKEDILSRFGELGISVEQGKLTFKPHLLRKQEFLKEPALFEHVRLGGSHMKLPLEANTLAFTYCQVPIVYELSDKELLSVFFSDESRAEFNGLSLDLATSRKVFDRTGEVNQITVAIKKQTLNE